MVARGIAARGVTVPGIEAPGMAAPGIVPVREMVAQARGMVIQGKGTPQGRKQAARKKGSATETACGKGKGITG